MGKAGKCGGWGGQMVGGVPESTAQRHARKAASQERVGRVNELTVVLGV